MKEILKVLFPLLLAVILVSCKDKPRTERPVPVKKPVQAAQGTAAKTTAAAKEKKKVLEVITYNPEGRRDPFLSIVVLTKQKVEHKKKTLNPLENYDVTDFRLLGVVYTGADYYASVVLPDGKAYTIKKGMTLGLYGGKVIDIKNDAVIIREYLVDYKGQLKPKDTVLKLRKEEE